LNLLFYLFRIRNWGFQELRGFWEDRSAWQAIIGAFSAYDYELRQEGH